MFIARIEAPTTIQITTNLVSQRRVRRSDLHWKNFVSLKDGFENMLVLGSQFLHIIIK